MEKDLNKNSHCISSTERCIISVFFPKTDSSFSSNTCLWDATLRYLSWPTCQVLNPPHVGSDPVTLCTLLSPKYFTAGWKATRWRKDMVEEGQRWAGLTTFVPTVTATQASHRALESGWLEETCKIIISFCFCQHSNSPSLWAVQWHPPYAWVRFLYMCLESVQDNSAFLLENFGLSK